MARRGSKAPPDRTDDNSQRSRSSRTTSSASSTTESRKRITLTPRESCDKDEHQSSSAPQTAYECGRCHLVPAADVKSGMGSGKGTSRQVTLKAAPCQYQDYRLASDKPLHRTREEMRTFNALNIGGIAGPKDDDNEKFGEVTLRENNESRRSYHIHEYGFDPQRYAPRRDDSVESIPRSAGSRLEYEEERKFQRDQRIADRHTHADDIGVLAQRQKDAKRNISAQLLQDKRGGRRNLDYSRCSSGTSDSRSNKARRCSTNYKDDDKSSSATSWVHVGNSEENEKVNKKARVTLQEVDNSSGISDTAGEYGHDRKEYMARKLDEANQQAAKEKLAYETRIAALTEEISRLRNTGMAIDAYEPMPPSRVEPGTTTGERDVNGDLVIEGISPLAVERRKDSSGSWQLYLMESHAAAEPQDHETMDHHARHQRLHLSLRHNCLLYTSPSPRDLSTSRMPSSA